MAEKVSIERIDSRKAIQLLEKNSYNRNIADNTVARYARIMLAGEWDLSGDAIVIATDNSVINGQHRLWAVAVSELSQRFVLLTGANPDSRLYVDTLRPRSAADTMRIHVPELGMRAEDIATLKAFYSPLPSNFGSRLTAWPVPVIERGAQKLLGALAFLREKLPTLKRGLSAPVRACVARAFYHIDPLILGRFAEVLQTGEAVDPMEFSAVKLRRILFETYGGTKRIAPVASFQYTQSAIQAFATKREIQILRATKEDLFPVLGEQVIDLSQAQGTPGGRGGRLNGIQKELLKGNVSLEKIQELKKLVVGPDNGV